MDSLAGAPAADAHVVWGLKQPGQEALYVLNSVVQKPNQPISWGKVLFGIFLMNDSGTHVLIVLK